MYSGFLVSGRGGGVFWELNDAASDALKFTDVLTTLANDTTDLKMGQHLPTNFD